MKKTRPYDPGFIDWLEKYAEIISNRKTSDSTYKRSINIVIVSFLILAMEWGFIEASKLNAASAQWKLVELDNIRLVTVFFLLYITCFFLFRVYKDFHYWTISTLPLTLKLEHDLTKKANIFIDNLHQTTCETNQSIFADYKTRNLLNDLYDKYHSQRFKEEMQRLLDESCSGKIDNEEYTKKLKEAEELLANSKVDKPEGAGNLFSLEIIEQRHKKAISQVPDYESINFTSVLVTSLMKKKRLLLKIELIIAIVIPFMFSIFTITTLLRAAMY